MNENKRSDRQITLKTIIHLDTTAKTLWEKNHIYEDDDEVETDYILRGGLGETKVKLWDEYDGESIEIPLEAIPTLIEWLQKVNEEINKKV